VWHSSVTFGTSAQEEVRPFVLGISVDVDTVINVSVE
jgi:hypothetical protein